VSDLFSSSSLSKQEKIARLQLSNTSRVGPITYRQLLSMYGSAVEALQAIPELSAKGGKKLSPPSKASVQQELAALEALGGEALFLGDGPYPDRLAAIDDAPPVLFSLGHTHLLDKDIIGMVGARNANAAGIKMTRDLAAGLSEAGIIVASGLARGIDTAAHATSLQVGTIACIAGGLDIVYPKENEALQDAIAAQGLLLSEAALGTRPTARHFPKRNRLISGIALGVIVVQAAKRSGSLITARQALEQGREVFAVPGSPLDLQSQGANQLIRDGAKLTQTIDDILEELSALRSKPLSDPIGLPLFEAAREHTSGDIERKTIEALLSHTAMPVDDIIRLSELPPGTVMSAILELELGGICIRYPGNRIALV